MKYALFPLLLGLAVSAQAAGPVRSNFIAPVDSGTYNVAFDDDNSISISCADTCPSGHDTLLKEDVASTPTGVMVPYENQNLIITTWATGSANLLIVYCLDGKKTRKIFQQYMNGRADIITTENPGLLIRLRQFVSERSKASVVRAWRWNSAKGVFVAQQGRKH
jgi:hypothetical protein